MFPPKTSGAISSPVLPSWRFFIFFLSSSPRVSYQDLDEIPRRKGTLASGTGFSLSAFDFRRRF
jgi:hypothetical protein